MAVENNARRSHGGYPCLVLETEERRVAGAELDEDSPIALGALLVATALLRIAAVGTGIAIVFRLTDLAGSRPSNLLIGLVGAGQGLTEMVFAPFLARNADRFGRTRFLVGGPLIGAVAVLLCTAGTHALQIGGARLLEGIAAAAFVPVALGTVAAATVSDRPARARASSAFEAATLSGYAGGAALGAFAYHSLHRGAFIVLAGVYMLSAAVCLWLVPRVPPMPVSPLRRVLRAALGRGPLRAFLPGWVAAFALLGAFITHLAAQLRQSVPGQNLNHHFDERLIGVLLDTWVALFVVGIVLWTPVLARLGPARVMRRAVPGAWLILATLLVINHTHLGLAPIFFPFLVIGVLWLAGFGPAAVTYLADCSELLTADRSALMSFYTVTLAAGGAAGSLLGGVATRLGNANGLIALGFILSTITFLSLGPVMRYASAGFGTPEYRPPD
jgi:predicted MFS family arabinose efflux permease